MGRGLHQQSINIINTAIDVLEDIQPTTVRSVCYQLFTRGLIASMGKLHAMLVYTSINEILAGDAAGFLHNIREQCLRIHELVYRYYVHYSIQSALAV